jgi:hypothetical protein
MVSAVSSVPAGVVVLTAVDALESLLWLESMLFVTAAPNCCFTFRLQLVFLTFLNP